jgi:hypothetical protein
MVLVRVVSARIESPVKHRQMPLGLDKNIRRDDSVGAMKADEYEAWRRVPPSERIRAVSELTMALYAMTRHTGDVPRLQRTLVRLKRPQR